MSTRKCKHISAMASPSIGEAGTTGHWRTVRPVVDQEKCSAVKRGANCHLCSDFCPEAVIPRETPITIDMEYCKGCGICADECPTGAIVMEPENKTAEEPSSGNSHD